MGHFLPVLALCAAVIAWHWFFDRKSAGGTRSPLWGAFTATLVAILFVTAGLTGYELKHGVPFTIQDAWSGRVLWAEIWVGAAVGVLAVFLWRAGLRSIRDSH